ncbi:hypothetical protein HYR99_32920 [Candidatus Poribacteria bacterium]|nr:hypothetical protein [Candidatus Poribacteria bacterium]
MLSLDLSHNTLPEALWLRLKQAATDYQITDLTQSLADVDALGADAHPLAERLQGLMERYDFQGILDLLGELHHEA